MSAYSIYTLLADRPSSGLTVGDTCFCHDTLKYYIVLDATTWGDSPVAPLIILPIDNTLFFRGDGTWAAPTGGSGDVVGPASSVDNRIAVFDGTTGKLIKDSGALLSSYATLASPTFTGTVVLPAAQIVNGVTLKTDQGATKFLAGDGTYITISGSGDMVLASAQTNSGIKTFLNTTMKFRNVANTFDGYFVNTNTADRIYTLQNRAGVLADDTDLALKANLASPTFTGTVGLPSGQVLVAPVLGTPASGNLANCTFPTLNQNTTGTAANVTTNANLTGHVTSSGNAAVLGSFTFAQLNTAVSDAELARTDAANTFTGVQTFSSAPVFSAGIPGNNLPNGITNSNSARQSQVVVSATNYYITSSNINLPAALKAGMVVGTKFVWRVVMTKTAAGTGIFQISIYRGTNGSTSDTQDVLQTIGTQTAAVDSMTVDVTVVVTTTGAAGAYYWSICPMTEAITATGFGVVTGTTGQFSGTVSGVAMNTASLIFGLGFKATTGTPTISVPLVLAQAFNIC